MKLKTCVLTFSAIALICHGSFTFAADITFPDCVVKTITSSISADRFSCKIKDGSRLSSLPLTVRINGVAAPSDTNTAAKATAVVKAMLSGAKKITLKNVRLSGYCTVTADVYVGRLDLGRHLLDRSLVDAVKPPVPRNVFEQYEIAPVPKKSQPVTLDKKYSDVQGGPIIFTPDMSLEDAFDMIANAASPDLPLLIMWKDLERNSFVDKDTSIGLQFSGSIQIKTALKMLLRSINAQYVVEGGVITIASNRMRFPSRKVTKVYDIREIIAAHVGDFGGGYGGSGGGFGNNNSSSYGNYGNNGGNFGNNSFQNRSSRSSGGF